MPGEVRRRLVKRIAEMFICDRARQKTVRAYQPEACATT
jgi:hypothetical protein